jgi:hypothetical protein
MKKNRVKKSRETIPLTLNPTGSDLHVSSTGSEHHLGPSGGGGGAAGVALTREREQG